MEKFTYFWKSDSPFSQWHKAYFEVDGVKFNCAEQYMMYKKAELFGDKLVMSEVLRETNPAKHKALGRKVKNFDKSVWEANCKQIVYKGNLCKFVQNGLLFEQLLATRGTTLVEASPYDGIWGIKLAAHDPRAKQRSTWLGKNWLGEILTKLRDDLIEEAKLEHKF